MNYGANAWDASFIGDPAHRTANYAENDDDIWDESEFDYWPDERDVLYRSKEFCQHKIKNSNRTSILEYFKRINRQKNQRVDFEEILVGNFCVVISAPLYLAEKYIIENLYDYGQLLNGKDGFSLNIYQFQENEICWLNPITDERFNMANWAQKLSTRSPTTNLSMDEVVKITAHCLRIEKLHTFMNGSVCRVDPW